ncbi:auxin response factor 5 isoform X2 [Prunus yedoensis var. nudiflora]|uniref:Auxin response factor 5 isoform X2 n=1 Tax=Prunus yedoensis var. nudiflora TaxID=2094558 RepID=A0A314YZR4_PRUYE|nr:auxin response factor 5 isoform X2 [Prunus yedoensis var. nudiflora]
MSFYLLGMILGRNSLAAFAVRYTRILSPTEVQQMSEEGMKLLNSDAMQGINGTMSKGGRL